MHSEIAKRRFSPLSGALILAALILAGCNGAAEREGERANQGVRDDVRGMRDFLGNRGITIDTRLPDR